MQAYPRPIEFETRFRFQPPVTKCLRHPPMTLAQNDPDTGRIFSQPPLISFKRDKNMGQPGTFKCARARCKTCLFICCVEKISGPKRSIKITNHFHLYLSQCHLLHNLHSLQKVVYRRSWETTGRPIPRTPSCRRRERRQKRI